MPEKPTSYLISMKSDCRFYKGSKPCTWNKIEGSECVSCDEYRSRGIRILIVKLDAVGDVLRSTCIVPKIKEKFPESYLTWITLSESIELLTSNPDIDEVWDYDKIQTLSRLHIETWDVVYNLDNSHASAAFASIAKAREKTGFVLTDSGITPTNSAASQWLNMAVFDRVKKENERSYQEIMYEICGFTPPISRPCIHLPDQYIERAKLLIADSFPGCVSSRIVGVNTGSGARWPKKMLFTGQIVEIIDNLLARDPDCNVLLLGGPREVEKNAEITRQIDSQRVFDVGCGHTLLEFAAFVEQCDVLLCGDTLALHIAAALNVKTIAVFGPTSYSEIHRYDGLIEKVQTDALDCLCCYGDCEKKENCMTLLKADDLVDKLLKRL